MTRTQRLTIATILVLALLRLTLLNAGAQAGATEYRLLQRVNGQVLQMPASPAPECYSFDDWGRSTRALTRFDGSWHIQIDARFALVVHCQGYEWSRVPNSPSIILDTSRIDSVMVYEDVNRMPHSVEATVCRYAPRLGISFCYTPVVNLESDSDGARWWVNVTSQWSITVVRIDGVRFNEYTLLTRTPDGRVITDPSDPSEFTPACWSFDGMGNSTRALVRWEERLHSWHIRIDERYHFALVCEDRKLAVIEDADRGMPGAVLIMDVTGMQSVMVYEDKDRQAVTVTATACYVNRWHGTFCHDAVVNLDADSDGARYWVNVNDGWSLTVMTEQEGAKIGSAGQ